MNARLLLSLVFLSNIFLHALRASESNVTLTDFKLTGDLAGDKAAFTLSATARVEDAHGGSLLLLSGPVALTAFAPERHTHVRAGDSQFFLDFDRRGKFPVQVKFTARVRPDGDWNKVLFAVAPSVLEPVVLRGLAADTQIDFAGAARPERQNGEFASFLPADGLVKFAWKEARPEAEGKLFFSAGMLAQASVSPGLMRQVALLDCKVMQGELSKLSLRLHGMGEVTRVQGDQILAWSIESISNSEDRRLKIQFNQPQKDQFSFQVQAQTPLGTFPQTADVLQLRPEGATRFAGYIRLANEGAVRLEVLRAIGTSQISPDQFPANEATRNAFRAEGNQRFAYRFAGADFALHFQADQILPEIGVAEILGYHVAENELDIDANLELDIREAPLRELMIDIPKGFAVARLNAEGLGDYFLTEPPGTDHAELRLVYGQPISDRQLVQLRLEHNQGLAGPDWVLPRVEVPRAKSVRGYIGAGADAGLRLTADRTKALTDAATAFYPGKLDGIQTAFRLTDSAWEASLHVERLPQTVQASALHLFSIGEGIAYGSSIINYVVSGAPIAAFKIELSGDYYNVEFTGKDVRNWQPVEGGYVVQLHTPVTGAYTLLATYERPFKPQGETLAFAGARPLDAQTEDGYTLITSAYQFDVNRVDVSPRLLALEPAEVPPEYRLFFDAPILAAYRYAARPFSLKLALRPLEQGNSLNQIVDRASLDTRISREGQALTDIRYFIKSRGNPHFRLTLPDGAQLWSVTVNGVAAVPIQDGKASLIPLPQSSDPNAVVELDLKLAAQSSDPTNLRIDAPAAAAPVMLTEWKLEPETGQHLAYVGGSVVPAGGTPDISGFAQLIRLGRGGSLKQVLTWLLAALGLAASAAVAWHRALRDGVYRTGVAAVAVLFILIVICFVQLTAVANSATSAMPADLTFLAPVQLGGTALSVAVANVADKITPALVLGYAWPVALALALWIAARFWLRTIASIAGWVVLAWAALRIPNGATILFWIIFAFLAVQLLAPALLRLSRLPGSQNAPLHPGASGATPATLALLLGGLFWLWAGATTARAVETPALPDSVTQSIRVQDKFAFGTAKIHWQAVKGQTFPVLESPAILTHISFPERALELSAAPAGSKYTHRLTARSGGTFDIEVQYQLSVTNNCFALPVPFGLINQVILNVVGLDVDVLSAQAVSIRCDHGGTNTLASLVLSPAETSVSWQPRRRDVKHEKPVFYTEVTQLYVPTAGVIEGAHLVSIRPAQGELSELVLTIPRGATVTDVTDLGQGALVGLWRFDPDSGKLRVTLSSPQSRPFAVLVRSQLAAAPLPFTQGAGLVAVDNAAEGQIGFAGIATGSEVQLDDVTTHALSPINLEDFPGEAVAALRGQMPDLTLRRAFRYSATSASLAMRVSAVEPDVRVDTDDTLSLGEDRTVLADNFTVDITRAGIFDLSFVMPPGFDIDSISSPALSQWTELKTEAGRVITLHLTGKTMGRQSFNLSLAGPGVKTARNWEVPQVIVREATKQRGSLLIVPEQGMRLQVARREGYTQLDPQKSGVRQKGVLGFHLLQTPAALALDIEQVDPWIQVASLQHAAISETQLKVTANLQYEIENTGLKFLHILIPANAAGVRFEGDELADFQSTPGTVTNGLQAWEVKLRRRVIGQYLLQVSYQILLPSQATNTVLRSVKAMDANTQRGFVTVESDPRIQVAIAALPESLQPAEWQAIPRTLQKGLPTVAANFTYRLVEPSFALALTLERHQAAKLLPARVNNVTFHSVIADDGVMLTSTCLEILPGDKRLLEVTLPPGAQFWFAFVNHSGVWPWRDDNKILIPMEQQSAGDKPVVVELFHSGSAGRAASTKLDLALLAPKFDLPLENITWKVSLSDKWRINHWAGSLQLAGQELVRPTAALDTQAYLQAEASLQKAQTAEAQQFLTLANNSLNDGNPQQARRAFAAAYGLSAQDAAFNEDARVQWHNIKLQEALMGLNARQSEAAGDPGTLGNLLRDLRSRREMNYTQQDAKDIIDINTADENAAFMRLAEKLIQQQDAAVNNLAGIRASIPEEGRLLTFTRDVAVDPRADLDIHLQATVTEAAPLAGRCLILAALLAIFAGFARSRRAPSQS